jgi:hypothetical protein
LDHGGETKQELEGALCEAAYGGHVVVVKMLMERGARLYSIHIWVAATLKYSCEEQIPLHMRTWLFAGQLAMGVSKL